MSPEIVLKIQVLENRRRLAEDQLKLVQIKQYDLAQQEAKLKALIVRLNNDVAAVIERRSVA